MKTDTKIILGALVASVALLAGAIAVLSKDTSPKRENLGSASMTVDKKSEDFGKMKGDEERTATFTLTNTGSSVLRVWNIATSCDCTFATLTIDGKETPEFNMPMHTNGNLKNWMGEITAGKTALLKVTYRPKVMPVTGPVTRQVTFSTNDPQNETVEVSVSANVM